MKVGSIEKKQRKFSQNKITELYSILKNHTNRSRNKKEISKLNSKSYSQSFNKGSRYQKSTQNSYHQKIIANSQRSISQAKNQNNKIEKNSHLSEQRLTQIKGNQNLKKKAKRENLIQKGPFQLPNKSLDKKHFISNLNAKSVKQNKSISHISFQNRGDNNKKKQMREGIRKIVLSQIKVEKKHIYSKKSNRQSSILQADKKNQQNQVSQKQQIKYKYSYRTRKGQQINNPKKVNQDSLLVKQNICKTDIHLFAVADGHGCYGHNISQHIIKSLSKLFSQEISNYIKQNKCSNTQNFEKLELHSILHKIYDQIQNELTCSEINASSSGSTLVNVIFHNSTILCANVGDSRAILAKQIDKKNWELLYLSQDHKPDSQSQKKRIIKNGGRIHPYRDISGQALGPARVWLPNQNIQGLAMSRSFGDNISKSIGVIHNPQMIKVPLDKNSKFLLIASDGVWEFISNQQILQLIVPYYKQNKLQQAADALLKLAYQRWTIQDDSVVDDITFVLIFFQ